MTQMASEEMDYFLRMLRKFVDATGSIDAVTETLWDRVGASLHCGACKAKWEGCEWGSWSRKSPQRLRRFLRGSPGTSWIIRALFGRKRMVGLCLSLKRWKF